MRTAHPPPTPSSSGLPPPNTVVVLPKQPAAGRASLWLLFWTVGVLTGYFAHTLLGSPGTALSEPARTEVASAPIVAVPSVEMNLRAVLELPTPTVTPTPFPTATSTTQPSTLNHCTTPEPGKVCQVPPPPPPTPTPYPSCDEMDDLVPGTWCRWPSGADGAEFDTFRVSWIGQ